MDVTRPTGETARNIAFIAALILLAVGAVGLLAPAGLVWIAEHSGTSGAFYVIAAARIALGFVLISAAPASRTPKTIRFLGFFVVIAGILTAVIGLVDMERARALIEWWIQQGSRLARLTGVLGLAVGAFLAWSCAPGRRAA